MIYKSITYGIVLLFSVTVASAQSKPAWSNVFKSINEEVEKSSAAYSNLKEATGSIGHRLTGSENGAKAEQFAYDLLKSYNFDVRFQPFEAESWSRGTISVTINDKAYKAVALAHSPVKADVTAPVVDGGNGLEEDYKKDSAAVKGKIVLVPIGLLPGSAQGLHNLHRSEKTALATKYAAAGVIFFNVAPGGILLTGTASVTGSLIPIPAVCISNEDGMQLKEELKQKAISASVKMSNFSGTVKSRNIIAMLKGKSLPNEKIVIGGHLDSWDLATGAIDNGIGSFSVIDIARTFAALKLQPARTIEFVLFMGEEEGLLGSKAYIAQAIKEGSYKKIRYMLNLDMSNDPRGYNATSEEDKALFQSIGQIAQAIDTSFKNTFSSGFDLHSDHQPFMLRGIPTAGVNGHLSREVLRCYHADCDSFDLVNETELKNTVRFSTMLLYGLADASALQAKLIPDNILKEKLIENNLKEPLQIAGEWRWGN
ncbi:MAG: M28 family peptidase [Chitinophagaceae bacterium]|nr:M28 family peptidase [Chitinophagaceae bacterium]